MRKKDFWTLVVCNLVTVILLTEHLCGIDLALECMIVWQILNMMLHIYILRDYAQITIFTEEIEDNG